MRMVGVRRKVMKPVCLKCRKMLRVKRNGVCIEEGRPIGRPLKEGKPDPDVEESWAPYKLWMGDVWECLTCGLEVVIATRINDC